MTTSEPSALEQLIASVEGQQEVYEADYSAAVARSAEQPREHAVDGVAHHVFNTLRGAEDGIPEGTFDDVRKIVAEAFGD